MIQRFVYAVDNFYPDPGAVRRRALALPFTEPEEYTGWRTCPYFQPGIKRRIEATLRLPLRRWSEDDDELNYNRGHGVFYFGLAHGPRAEMAGVHVDRPADWVTMIVYLTPDAPADAGTSLWQHRATNLTAAPTARDAARLNSSVEELEEVLEQDGLRPARWRELDRIGNIYNRAVFYRSGLLHSATRHFGSNLRNGRLYQTFRFAVGPRATKF